jgi:hypothetical protein
VRGAHGVGRRRGSEGDWKGKERKGKERNGTGRVGESRRVEIEVLTWPHGPN